MSLNFRDFLFALPFNKNFMNFNFFFWHEMDLISLKLPRYQQFCFQSRVRSHKRRNKLVSNRRESKFCSHEVSFRLHSKRPIFWWTCVGMSFRVAFTWYFIMRNEISFLWKWPIWNPYPHWVSNAKLH